MPDTKKKKPVFADNPIEQFKETVAIVTEPARDIMDEALKQIGLKEPKQPLSGEINLDTGEHKINQLEVQVRQLRAVQTQEKEVYNLKEKGVKNQIQKLMQEVSIEVTKLQKQTAELSGEIKSITVETIPAKPGAYHLNYFDWVIGMLRDLRKRVNESRHWLALWSQKKKQKGYWAMFKKHGTSFAMSEERAIASANG